MRDQYEDFEKLIEAGELGTAELRLFEWIRDHPNDSYAWMLYGKCVSNPAQKRDCFERALALDAANIEARELLNQLEANFPQLKQKRELTRVNTASASSSTISTNRQPNVSALRTPMLSEPTKMRLAFALYSLFHFLFTVLIVCVLIFLFASFVPGLLDINKSGDNIQRNWLSTSGPSDTSQGLRDLAKIFLNPSRLDYRSVSTYQELRNHRTSITASTSGDGSIEFTGVSLVGQLIGGYVLESGQDGQPLVIVMNILFDETRIPVVYYGPSNQFNYEAMVLVEGVYIEDGNGIVAQHVEQLSTGGEIDPSTLTIIRVAGLILLWSLFCFSVFFWRVNYKAFWQAKTKSSAPMVLVLLLLHSLLMAGCTLDLSTTLQPDGSGVTSILIHESTENMEFLRSAPGVPGYLSAVVQDMQQSGAMFEQYVEGDQEVFFIQRYFNTASADVGDTYPIEGSWISVQRYTQGNEDILRFLGIVDTRTLYGTTDTVDSNVASALRDQLDQIDMKYHLHFPGHLTYHNGEATANREVIWNIRMNDVNYLVAEVRLPFEENQLAGFDVRLIWLALGAVFIISSAFLIAGLWIRPARQVGRKS
jgi:hypothetical protein